MSLSEGQQQFTSPVISISSGFRSSTMGLLSVNTVNANSPSSQVFPPNASSIPGKPMLSSPTKNRGRPRKEAGGRMTMAAAVPLNKGLGVKIKRQEGYEIEPSISMNRFHGFRNITRQESRDDRITRH
jgi:hypothetical protein